MQKDGVCWNGLLNCVTADLVYISKSIPLLALHRIHSISNLEDLFKIELFESLKIFE